MTDSRNAVYSWLQARRNAAVITSPDDVRVMCIGESTTGIGGADSYPTQLQEILQARLPAKKVTVANCGIPGGNTRIILERLEADLDRCKPQVVVSMMGANDHGGAVPFASLDEERGLLEHVRVYRLYRYLRAAWQKRGEMPAAPSHPRRGQADGEGGPSATGEETGPDALEGTARLTSERLTRKGRQLDKQVRIEEAMRVLTEAATVDATNPHPLVALAEIRMMRHAQHAEAVRLLLRAAAIAPEDAGTWLDLAYCYEAMGKPADAEAMYARAAKGSWQSLGGRRQYFTSLARYLLRHKLDDPAARMFVALEHQHSNKEAVLACASWYWGQRGDLVRRRLCDEKLRTLREGGFVEETRSNYRKLQRILKQRGIRFICMQYACRRVDPLVRLFEETDDVVFVENLDNFRSVIEAGGFFELFVDNCYGDMGHCTRRGNRLIAESVADAILKR